MSSLKISTNHSPQLDRVNLSVARAVGADHALGLSIGSRYTIVAVVFFIPYIILELPSNLLLRRVGPAIWLSAITLLWGAVMLGEKHVLWRRSEY